MLRNCVKLGFFLLALSFSKSLLTKDKATLNTNLAK